MRIKLLIVFVLFFFILGCSPKNKESSKKVLTVDKTISIEETKKAKFIDISLDTDLSSSDAPYFYDSNWSVAVRNLKSEDIYYYDRENNLLGKRSICRMSPKGARESFISNQLMHEVNN